MTKTDDYVFNVPCAIGTQGSQPFMLLSVPFRALRRLLVLDNSGHVLDRSQRELNPARVRKIGRYLTDAMESGQPFILPPLIGNCNSPIRFVESDVSGVGRAELPMDAVIELFDGQHRSNAIIQYCSSVGTGNQIGLMLFQNVGLKQRQQFFSDINNTATKPSAAISMAYDTRDELARTVKAMIGDSPALAAITDFEHNTVPAASEHLVSFKPLCDATARFICAGDERLDQGQIGAIWASWMQLTGAAEVQGIRIGEYRKEFIQFYGVMLHAFGLAVQTLRQSLSPSDVAAQIALTGNGADQVTKERFFTLAAWEGCCVVRAETGLKIQADIAAQRRAAARLTDALRAGQLS